jgi:hypothetical protein
MYAQRQMAQAAADASAEAGIMSVYDGTNGTSAFPFGTGATPVASSVCTLADSRTPCVYARDNGFGGTVADTVTLSYPATVSGVSLSAATVPAFTVTVQRTLKTGLMRFLGVSTSSVTTKATAGIVGAVSSNCIYVLDPAAQNSFSASNGASIAVNGCGIVVDSTNATAMSITGGVNMTAATIQVTGGMSITGGSTVAASAIQAGGTVALSGGSSVTPVPTPGTVAPIADPFADVPAPAVGACDFNNTAPGMGLGRSTRVRIAEVSTSAIVRRLHSIPAYTSSRAAG